MAMHSEVYYVLLEIQYGRFFFAETHWFPPDSGSRTIEPSSHKSQSQLHVGNQKCVEISKFTDRQADANEGWRGSPATRAVVQLHLANKNSLSLCGKEEPKASHMHFVKKYVLKKMMVNHHRSSIVIFHWGMRYAPVSEQLQKSPLEELCLEVGQWTLQGMAPPPSTAPNKT